MGMDLNGAGGIERFNNTSWCKMLELAYEYGWKPAGTEPGQCVDPSTGELVEQLSPDPDEWDGNYVTNDLQWVTDEDAARIADALEKALDDIPDVEQELANFEAIWSSSPLEFFSGESKQRVRDFIAYCRAGAFFIA